MNIPSNDSSSTGIASIVAFPQPPAYGSDAFRRCGGLVVAHPASALFLDAFGMICKGP